MTVFMIYIRDEDYYRLLPAELQRSRASNGRLQVMAFPPLGIQTLAPVLRQHGHQVRMFDTCHPRMKVKHIVEAVKSEWPDVIALSFISTTTYLNCKRMAQSLKSVAPETPIIVGGAFATINPVQILEDCPDIDCVGVGEGEELLPDYIDHLADLGSVAGLVWRRGEEIIRNSPRPVIQDLNRFPYADRTSLPIDYLESLPLDVPAVLSLDKFCTMQTSRGCPFNCIYCDIPSLSQRKWRYRSPAHVLGEMQQLSDQGYRSVYLTDDHFLLNRKRISQICHGMIARQLKFRWGCEGRVDSAAVDQLAIMSKARCSYLAFGVESGTQKVLDQLGKHQTLEQIEYAVGEAKRHGISRTHGFFIIGSPGETEEDILNSFRFAARLELDTFVFGRLSVYRGTPLWQQYVNRGIIDDRRDWHKWFKCCDIDPDVLPTQVVNRARMKGYALLFARRIFGRPIQSYTLLRSFTRHMKMSDIIRLLISPFCSRTLARAPTLPASMVDSGLEAPVRDPATVAPAVTV